MRVILAIILLFALTTPTEARRRKRPTKRRAPITRPCPPCAPTGCPDKIITLTQAEAEAADSRRAQSRHNFERSFAEWLARQPDMSPAAASVLRETARVWYGRGRGEVIQK